MDRARQSELTSRVAPFASAIGASGSGLDELALLLSSALQPRLDVIEALTSLDELAAGCPTPTRDAVLGYLFGTGQFVGDRRDYHRWQNSCLDHVIEARRGMPITLAIVGIEVARRLGIELVGVGMPGHFLIGDQNEPGWYADPYHGRVGLGVEECRALLLQMGVTRWSDRYLEPTPVRLVIARMLNNLKLSCEQRDDRVRLAIVMQMRQALGGFGGEYADAIRSFAVFN